MKEGTGNEGKDGNGLLIEYENLLFFGIFV
jgi:hypothetical protein